MSQPRRPAVSTQTVCIGKDGDSRLKMPWRQQEYHEVMMFPKKAARLHCKKSGSHRSSYDASSQSRTTNNRYNYHPSYDPTYFPRRLTSDTQQEISYPHLTLPLFSNFMISFIPQPTTSSQACCKNYLLCRNIRPLPETRCIPPRKTAPACVKYFQDAWLSWRNSPPTVVLWEKCSVLFENAR